MTRILIVDEMDLVTHSARLALAVDPGWQVIGEAHTLADALKHLKMDSPDVIITSDAMDHRYSHFRLLDSLLSVLSIVQPIFIGSLMDGYLLQDLLRCGLRAYLHRGDPLRECLPAAMRALVQSSLYLSPTASASYLTAMQANNPLIKLDKDAYVTLQLLVQGSTAGQIARELGIPIRRVYMHFEKLRRRFNATTNAQMISRAAAEGFATLLR